MLQNRIASQVVEIALSDPLGIDTPERILDVVASGLESGFYITAIAEAVDAACVSLPLQISAISRAALLSHPAWNDLITADSVPTAWDSTAVNLANSFAGTNNDGLEILHATAHLGDGGQFALAGMLNPVFEPLPLSEFEWHPKFTSPPIRGLAMLHPSVTLRELSDLSAPFINSEAATDWCLAPILGPQLLVPWPEWQAVIDWISGEEPTGTIAFWTWFLNAVEMGHLAETLGTSEQWWNTPMWQSVVQQRLGYVIGEAESLQLSTNHDVEVLDDLIQRSTWPPLDALPRGKH